VRSRLQNPNILLLAVFLGVALVVGAELVAVNTHVDPTSAAVQRRKAFVASWKPLHPPGTPAPEFQLLDLNGVKRSLSEFRGRPVVLTFYSADRRSRIFLRELRKIREHIGMQKMVTLSVVDFPRREALALAKTDGDRNIFLLDEGAPGRVHQLYGAAPGPNAWVINPKGELIYATPPIETDLEPEPELEGMYRALRSLIPARRPGYPRIPDG